MQRVRISNNLMIPENFKHFQVNDISTNTRNQEHFQSGIRNANRLLNNLERSFEKSCKYENKLLKCKSTQNHKHECKDYCSNSSLTPKESVSSIKDNTKSSTSKSITTVMESWSTMSIVCLQHQYEELSKRYEALLRAYDEHCKSPTSQDTVFLKLRRRIEDAHVELAQVNKALLIIGDKYLSLKYKRLRQKVWYEERIHRLKHAMRAILVTAERARRDLDQQLSQALAAEHDTAITLLLNRIKMCNLLFLENLRLKSRIEEII